MPSIIVGAIADVAGTGWDGGLNAMRDGVATMIVVDSWFGSHVYFDG